MKRVVVIGGGISGMCAALLLARRDFVVTLAEKAPRLAPLVRGFRRKGIHFDTGFHHTGYLAPGEILDRLFRLLDVTGLEAFPLGLDGGQKVRFLPDATEYPMPSGFDLAFETLGGLFPAERPSLSRYIALVKAAQESSIYLSPEKTVQSEGLSRGESLAEVLDGLFTEERLKALLASQTLYHGVPPSDVPFVFHARVGAAGLRSLHGVRGGGAALARVFEAALDRAGVRCVTGSGATGVEISSAGGVSAVRLENGDVLDADAAIYTGHPAGLQRLAPPGVFRPAYCNRIAALPETPCGSMLFWELAPDAALQPGQSWLFLNGLDPDGWFGDGGRSRPGSMSLMAAPGGSPAGGMGLEQAICADGACEDRVQAIGSAKRYFEETMPELFSRAVLLDAAMPSTFARFTNSPHGSFYGVRHSLDSYPLQPRTRLPGLFLSGQATVAPGVAGAAISACVTVDAMLGTAATAEELRRC
jgi:all-trans-retinol 13,14-reductase